jgi:hypothetical protein
VKKVKEMHEICSDLHVDVDDDLAKSPAEHGKLQESVQIAIATLDQTLSLDATAEGLPCPPDVAPSRKQSNGKLSNICTMC